LVWFDVTNVQANRALLIHASPYLRACPLQVWGQSKNKPMFENLSDKLERAFKVLKGQGQITEINVAETMKEVRRALLDADVHFKTAKEFTDRVKAKALGQNVLTSVSPGQLLTKITNDELAELMGGKNAGINLSGNPTVVLMSGLQGSGKTTFSGKLANYIRKKGKRVLLTAADVYRPAAIDQLETLGKQLDITVYASARTRTR
jgi:signal recognition particle subunit SRP54